jgi:hypothetical protein
LSQLPAGKVLLGQRILARHSGKRIVWVVTLQHRQAALIVTANLKGHTFHSHVREAWQLPPCNAGEALHTCNTIYKHYLIQHQSLASTKLRHRINNRSTNSKIQSSSSAKHAIRPPPLLTKPIPHRPDTPFSTPTPQQERNSTTQMCTRDTIHHTGCGCERANNYVTFCSITRLYPHTTCPQIASRRVDHSARANRICKKCLDELNLSCGMLCSMTGMGHAPGLKLGA